MWRKRFIWRFMCTFRFLWRFRWIFFSSGKGSGDHLSSLKGLSKGSEGLGNLMLTSRSALQTTDDYLTTFSIKITTDWLHALDGCKYYRCFTKPSTLFEGSCETSGSYEGSCESLFSVESSTEPLASRLSSLRDVCEGSPKDSQGPWLANEGVA